MSLYDYERSRELDRGNEPFAAFIMAAARKADSDNLERLEAAFPEIVAELRARYNAPGGRLPIESEALKREREADERHDIAQVELDPDRYNEDA